MLLAMKKAPKLKWVSCMPYTASLSHLNLYTCLSNPRQGTGALAAPLVATQFSTMSHWSFHYLCSLGIALATTVALILVFRFKTQEVCLLEIGQRPKEEETAEQSSSKYKQILTTKNVHLLALFILIYVG